MIMASDMTKEFEGDLQELTELLNVQKYRIIELKLEVAKYRAGFFHRTDLYKRIEKQQIKNDSGISSPEYRTLEDMKKDGLITTEEYIFCTKLHRRIE